MVEDQWLTVDEVSTALRVHPESVRRWLRSGELAGVFISRRSGYRIRASEFDRFLKERGEMTGKLAA